jgi:glycopeptide antibiotics resistance protein
MVVREIIKDMWPTMWPLMVFVSVIAISMRLTFLKGNSKIILHKELMALVFIIYILCLYFIVIGQDISSGGVNLIPFKEMFRYQIGSDMFLRNIIGNILLFVPYGFFSSYYLSNKKIGTNVLLCLVATFCIETIQYYIGRVFDIDDIILNVIGGFIGCLIYVALTAIKAKLPKFMKSGAFLNLLFILVIIIGVICGFRIDILSYL